MSADEYRAELESACSELDDTIRGLPQRQNDEDLTIEEAGQIAEQASEEYAEQVEALDPPGELAGAHGDLVALIEDPLANDASPDEAVGYFERVVDAYGALGSEDCEARASRSLDALRQSIESFENAPGQESGGA